jgi:hypothetical protein
MTIDLAAAVRVGVQRQNDASRPAADAPGGFLIS